MTHQEDAFARANKQNACEICPPPGFCLVGFEWEKKQKDAVFS